MSTEIDHKLAIVTGGSRGIGRAIAQQLSHDGFYIIINYVSNDDAARHTLDLIETDGGSGEIVKFDVKDREKVDAFIAEISSRFTSIDVLVNNAGIARDGLFVMTSDEDWDAVIDTTLKGFYNMTKPVLKKMIRQRYGNIVSISSVSALIGNKAPGKRSLRPKPRSSVRANPLLQKLPAWG